MKNTEILTAMENMVFENLSEDVIAVVKKCLLDYIGVAIAGSRLQAARIAREASIWLGNTGPCAVFGGMNTVGPLAATYSNATSASCLDMDDGHRLAVGHPGAMVFPALFALIDMGGGMTGRDLITAAVNGYELAIRCGIVLNSVPQNYFYGSGGWAIFGTALAAGKILKLEPKVISNSLGICEVYGPTAQCGKSIADGAMSKESIGWGSMTGLYSIFLARQGFSGPKGILLDEHMYDPSSLEIFKTLGQKYEILNTYFKLYSSCRWSHSPITATLNICNTHAITPDQIECIEVYTFKKALSLCHHRPETSEAAEYSIPFTVANAIMYGQVGPEEVAESNLHNEAVLDLASKVKLFLCPEFEELFPETRPAMVKVFLKNGRCFEEKVLYNNGDPEFPLSWGDVCEKFARLTSGSMLLEDRDRIADLICNLEKENSLEKLTACLRGCSILP